MIIEVKVMEYKPQARELFEAFIRARKHFRADRFLDRLNLSEMIVFWMLWKRKLDGEKELLQVKDLSDKMGISRPALNTVLNRLEDRKLIKRVRKHADRRAVFVEMSAPANELYQSEKVKLISFLNRIVTKLGPEDTEKAIGILNRLANIMKNEVDE